jgi:alanine racemase
VAGAAAGALRPVLAVRARVVAVHDLRAGDTVGYHPGFTAPRPTRIAVLPIGYADGYAYRLGNRGRVLLGGRAVPVAGPVSMDCTAVDVGPGADVAPGDVATLLGADGPAVIGAAELAEGAGTIPYEVLTRLGAGLPRRYRASAAAAA